MGRVAGNIVGLKTPLATCHHLLQSVTGDVRTYMSRFDASHDFHHIERVLGLAKHVLSETRKRPDAPPFDETAVHLAALLHDVGDRKYIQPGEDAEQEIAVILSRGGASAELVRKVTIIVKNVSFTSEMKDPGKLQAVLLEHPELAIVQDADRLDSIGAIGIGRTFTYGGAKGRGNGIQGSLDHFPQRLEKVEALMKTEVGKQMARERTERLRIFRDWWEQENSMHVEFAQDGAEV